jgi:hypothetical protein
MTMKEKMTPLHRGEASSTREGWRIVICHGRRHQEKVHHGEIQTLSSFTSWLQEGNTPLHLAMLRQSAEVVRATLSAMGFMDDAAKHELFLKPNKVRLDF